MTMASFDSEGQTVCSRFHAGYASGCLSCRLAVRNRTPKLNDCKVQVISPDQRKAATMPSGL